jgi:DNA topoisomerase-1
VSKSLLIVESPAKCKTISKYLGGDFVVKASYGHVRDLPSKNGSVDVKNDFAMRYDLIERNIGHVNDLIREARHADTIYLATDLDREGEAISWHISEILKEKGITGKTIHRITFSEITPKALKAAVAAPRALAMSLVDAQQTRRALDYLVGFNLSPVLWRKLQKGLSAGRVQSPALRLIVEREEEIEAFKPQEYWTIEADLFKDFEFRAKLVQYMGEKLTQFSIDCEEAAMNAKAYLEAQLQENGGETTVSSVVSKERRRRPYAPFTTSTLQQEASRKLGFSTSKTMQIAQSLYEGVQLGGEQVGIITYMRTDSVNLSQDALEEIRSVIRSEYGEDMMPPQPNVYQSKAKNAQEAHEAIRPSSVKRHPKDIAKYLDDGQRKLYELIWKRTVACQMASAILDTVTVEFLLPELDHARDFKGAAGPAIFRASGSTVKFPGFLAVYDESRDTKDEDENRKLPLLKEGDRVKVLQILADQHFTEPPPRFNEATLVKTLEEFGIGRPSTYATIIQVLQNREYVKLENRRFTPTDIGRAVSHFLTQHFPKYVDYQFTANLEDELDAISRGEHKWLDTMRAFWEPFKAEVDKGMEVSREEAQGARMLGMDPVSGKPVGVRIGRFGPVAFKGNPANKEEKLEFASLLENQHLNSITLEEALQLFAFPKTLGHYEGKVVVVNRGKFGPYVVMENPGEKSKEGRIIASLPEGEDPNAIGFDRAVELLVAKKSLIENRDIADLGDGIKVLNGNYGPYIQKGDLRASVPKGTDPKSVTKEEALRILADREAKKGKGGGGNRFGKKGGKFKKGKKGGNDDSTASSGSQFDDLPM